MSQPEKPVRKQMGAKAERSHLQAGQQAGTATGTRQGDELSTPAPSEVLSPAPLTS